MRVSERGPAARERSRTFGLPRRLREGYGEERREWRERSRTCFSLRHTRARFSETKLVYVVRKAGRRNGHGSSSGGPERLGRGGRFGSSRGSDKAYAPPSENTYEHLHQHGRFPLELCLGS